MTTSGLIQDLNPPQQKAVQNTEGPLLVLAGAGSGKTRVLTYRIAYILEKGLARPDQILAVTFTNKAASEMKSRIERLLNIDIKPLWIGTFHSISARILHHEARHAGYKSNFTIYDTTDQENQIKRIMEYLDMNRQTLSPRSILYEISDAKNKLIDARQYDKNAEGVRSQKIAKIFRQYEVALRRNNAFDFDDLIIKPIEIFSNNPKLLEKYQKKFRYILVDEYQDTNRAQYYWIKLLAKAHRNLCVVGDEDQSIYGWRGADIGNILNFENDYPQCTIIRLEQNYRSTQTILNAANALVSCNDKRLGKELWSEQGTGEKIMVSVTQDEVAEAVRVASILKENSLQNGYSYNDMVILYRTNAQSRALEEQLRRSVIPYSIVGGTKFYERKEIKDILAYLKILVNPSDSVSLQRIINFPVRGIGDTTLRVLNEYAFRNSLSLYEALAKVNQLSEIRTGIRASVQGFYEKMNEIRDTLNNLNAYQITEQIIEDFHLKHVYEKSDLVEDKTRAENINELLNGLKIFISSHPDNNRLADYLDEISLLTDIDRWDPDKPAVTLMTLHSAKGLEFPVVIITGLEDGLLPLRRNSDEEQELEEERRLFYVGMTRAKEKLYLLSAQTRHRFSQEDSGMAFRSFPSRFLKEIPKQYCLDNIPEDYIYFSDPKPKIRDPRLSRLRRLEKLPDEGSDFKIGQYVFHDVFGRGQVLGVDITRQGTKLTVHFENKSIKKLIAEYANLTISDSLE